MGLTDEKFSRVEELEQGFDSYGGIPPTAKSIEAAKAFQVIPRNDGGLGIIWVTRSAEVEVEFDDQGSVQSVIMERRQ